MNSFAKQLDIIFPIILPLWEFGHGHVVYNILEKSLGISLEYRELSNQDYVDRYGNYVFAYYPKGCKYTNEELWKIARKHNEWFIPD